jgi:hypothetical protein
MAFIAAIDMTTLADRLTELEKQIELQRRGTR